jgi:hypothetical protein
MKTRQRLDAWLAWVTTALLTATGAAHANMGPPAYVVDLTATQEGQDVVLTVGLVEENGSTGPIIRIDNETDEEVVIGEKEHDSVPTETRVSARCAWYSIDVSPYIDVNEAQYCPEHPDECTDCDGDELPECLIGCAEANYYLFRDRCVPPGSYTYEADVSALGGGMFKTIEVDVTADSYDVCSAPVEDTDTEPPLEDTDTGSAVPEDSDQDTGEAESDDGDADTGEEIDTGEGEKPTPPPADGDNGASEDGSCAVVSVSASSPAGLPFEILRSLFGF